MRPRAVILNAGLPELRIREAQPLIKKLKGRDSTLRTRLKPELNDSQKKTRLHLAIKRTETGLGLFTLRPIAAGARIIEYKGPILDEDEAEETGGKYLFELDDAHVIDGSARSNIARYINHACCPNAEER